MKSFAYARAASVEEAQALSRSDGTQLLAGGTDLLTLMKEHLVDPDRLVDIGRIGDLRGVARSADGLRIGALTTLTELEEHPATPEIVRQALADAATPQLRNAATVGGNMLQRNRCWYFRSEAHRCWLKGGSECLAVNGENRYHAVFGEGECRMATPSDLAPALIALDASVSIRGDDGERNVPLAELFVVPTATHRREHSIREGDVILAISIGADALRRRGTYMKFMERAAWQFAVVSIAASARVENGRAQDVRLMAGAVASVPWRSREVEAMLEGRRIDESSAAESADRFVQDARPLRQNAYKVRIARELVRRALLRIAA